jgi:hypothetical protein
VNTQTGKQVPTPSQEEIAEAAYYIWEKEGCFHGRAAEHWLQAEARLIADRTRGQTAAGEAAPGPDLKTATAQLLQSSKKPTARAGGRARIACMAA